MPNVSLTCGTCGIEVTVTVVDLFGGNYSVTVDANGLAKLGQSCHEVRARGGIRSGDAQEYRCGALAISIGKPLNRR